MTDGIDCWVAGEALVLFRPTDGTPLRNATDFRRDVAGAESNVAVGLARLGRKTAFLGAVGDDEPGRWVRSYMQAEGVNTDHLRDDPSAPTGLIIRDLATGSLPASVLYYRTNSAGARFDGVPVPRLAPNSVVFFSGITVMLTTESANYVDLLSATAEKAGATIVFDPNIRLRLAPLADWQSRMPALFARSNTILIGHRELELLGIRDPRDLLTDTTTEVVVRRGELGAEAFTATEKVKSSARTVIPVDLIGAGDAFSAGWIAARLDRRPLVESLEFGCLVAGLAVAAAGDTAGLPTRRQIRQLLDGQDVAR